MSILAGILQFVIGAIVVTMFVGTVLIIVLSVKSIEKVEELINKRKERK